MTPSVGGRERARTGTALFLGSCLAGAVAGYVLGVAWLAAGAGPLPRTVAATLVVAAVVLDITPWRPPAVGTQVPRQWAALLPLPTAAALYGMRLGVGPLTLLPTWLWWAAATLGASTGVSGSATVGALFGGARAVSILVASKVVEPAMAPRMATLRRAGPAVAALLGLVVTATAVAALRPA